MTQPAQGTIRIRELEALLRSYLQVMTRQQDAIAKNDFLCSENCNYAAKTLVEKIALTERCIDDAATQEAAAEESTRETISELKQRAQELTQEVIGALREKQERIQQQLGRMKLPLKGSSTQFSSRHTGHTLDITT